MIDDNVIQFADACRQRDAKYDLLADLAEVFEMIRVDYDVMRRILHPMSMKERGIVGSAMFEALTAPSPTMDQVALLLVVAKRQSTEDQRHET